MKNMTEAVVASYRNGPVTFMEYQPGNGTRYQIVISSFVNLSAEVTDRIGCECDSVLVSLLNFPGVSPMIVKPNGGLLHYGYVMEKMKLGMGDAVAIAILIGWFLGRPAIQWKEAGVEDCE